jgi:HAMP domain-containing protein
MKEPLQLNRLNADAWTAGLLDLSDTVARERYFANHIQAFSHTAMTFIGQKDGTFYGARRKASGEIQVVRNNRETGGDSWYYAVSPQGDAGERQEIFRRFDPRLRPWYESAAKLGKPTFSSIYRHFVFHEPTITAAHPVYDADGSLAGVFGVDYLLSWLGDTLRRIPVGASGQIFITDAEGFLVAASTSNELFRERDGRFDRVRAADAQNPVLKIAVQSFQTDADGTSREIEYDNRTFMVDAKIFRENGIDWKIYVVLASDDFLGGINEAVYRTVWVTIFAITIACFLAVWTAGWVTRPILRLNAAARELAEGRLQSVPDTDRKDELGQLAHSFNAMAHRITDLVESLELKVAERTRALAEKTEEEQRLRAVLHAELAKAGKEQRAMLPPDIDRDRLRLKIIYEPCMLVSGDFCGYHWLEEENILFGYVFDVTGHGAATALRTAAINFIIQDTLHAGDSLAARMAKLNERIGSYLGDDTMVAACCFQLYFRQKRLDSIAAGITEFFAATSSAQGRIKTPGLFLGLSEQPGFETVAIPLQEGDIICFYSDGIADQLANSDTLPVKAPFAEIVQAFENSASGGVRRDDCTAMCIEIRKL